MSWIITIIEKILDFILFVLPTSPFERYNQVLGDIPFLQELNWFLPFGTCIGIAETWLLAISVYYLYMLFARKIGLIS